MNVHYIQGRAEFEDNLPLECNPYHRLHRFAAHMNWRRGWADQQRAVADRSFATITRSILTENAAIRAL